MEWLLDLRQGIDLAIYCFGKFEPNTCRALERLVTPGMTVFDIGANVGAHALPLARLVGPGGKVFAVEPTDFAFSKLANNLDLNPKLKQTLELRKCGFVSDKCSPPREFYASWDVLADGETHDIHGGKLCEATDTNYVTLDAFVDREKISRLDVIKLDVDGFESHILAGGRNTLARFRPVIVTELCPYAHTENGSDFSEMIGSLRELGYQFKNEQLTIVYPSDCTELERIIPPGGTVNVVAVPS